MALTKTFPTGDPAGLSIVDTRRVIGSLIVCDTSGNPRLGVLPRNTSPIVTSTASLNYAVAGAGFVTSRTGAGAELLSNDGTTNVLTTAAPASNARTDVVWVRPQFTASADASNTPVFGVTQGVTSGTVPPPEPAIPAGALKLATVYFPSGATATNSAGVVITQVYPFTATAGGTPLFRSTTELNLWAAADSQVARVLGGSEYVRTDGVWRSRDRVAGVRFDGNTNVNGILVVNNPLLGMTPTWVQVTMGRIGASEQLSQLLSAIVWDSPVGATTIQIRFRRHDTNAWAANQPVSGYLTAGG